MTSKPTKDLKRNHFNDICWGCSHRETGAGPSARPVSAWAGTCPCVETRCRAVTQAQPLLLNKSSPVLGSPWTSVHVWASYGTQPAPPVHLPCGERGGLHLQLKGACGPWPCLGFKRDPPALGDQSILLTQILLCGFSFLWAMPCSNSCPHVQSHPCWLWTCRRHNGRRTVRPSVWECHCYGLCHSSHSGNLYLTLVAVSSCSIIFNTKNVEKRKSATNNRKENK